MDSQSVDVYSASGFIGLPVARAFVRAGHIVYGLTRSEKKAKQLAAEESKYSPPSVYWMKFLRKVSGVPVIPVVALPADTASWIYLIASLDVVVEALGGVNGDELRAVSEKILKAVADASTQYRPSGSAKIAYVYTSGSWVYGDNRNDILTDTTPITEPVELVAWRPVVEQLVVTNPAVNGVVIRPSMVYGYSGSILGMMFKRAYEGKVTWFGTAGARQSLVHADDLADLYLKAAEKATVVAGLIFVGANDFTESVDEILAKLVEVSGAEGSYEYIEPTNGEYRRCLLTITQSDPVPAYEAACTASAILRPYLARTLLGWQPRKPGIVDNLGVYYSAWKASASL